MAKGGAQPLKISYHSVGRHKEFIEELIKAIPVPLRPTQKTAWICLGLLLVITCWGIIQALMPVMNLSFDISKGEAFELKIDVGFPMVFFGTTDNGTKINFDIIAIIIDTLLCLLVGYILDILINLVLSMKLGESAEERRRKPKVFFFKPAPAAQQAGDEIVKNAAQKQQPEQKPAKVKEEPKKTTNPKEAPAATKLSS